jgi:3'(2'), 5'-bisphosphate nucleotidase
MKGGAMNPPENPAILDAAIAAAIEAGRVILEVRARGLAVETKADQSPVTEADRGAEAIIAERMEAAAPGVPMIGEEAVYEGRIPDTNHTFFLVDPLDGTREFVKGGNDFTVNIGLVRERAPVLGVIYLPASGRLFAGAVGAGAWRATVSEGGAIAERRPIQTRPVADGVVDVVASRSHLTPETEAFIARYRVGKLVHRGSSLKFCVVAEGKADLYPRMGTTMQWDTAAGDAILRAAGGRVVTLDGDPLTYGPTDGPGPDAFRNPWFIATGGMEPLLSPQLGSR